MMKKGLLLLILSISLLSGCSALDQVNQSVNYVSEATSYIDQASQFSSQLPELTQQAVVDKEARTQLVQELQQMQTQINQFSNVEAPGFAQDLHQKLIGYNETLGTEINGLIDQAQAGQITLEKVNNSQIFQTIDQINGLMNQFQQLDQ